MANLQIPRFKDRADFQSWWTSPPVAAFFTKYPDKLAVLFEHPWVKPYEDVILGAGGQTDKQQAAEIKTFGKYQLVKKLGQGGMGAVYLAYDPALSRQVALKVMLLKGAESIERFQREARASAKLKHPNILPLYEIGTLGKYHYFTMDYIEGQSLADMVNAKRLNHKQLAGIIKAIASALAYAHRTGIIHRDIKPANILLDKQGVPYLADFGLAKETSKVERSLTISGTIVGTPDYMSPEQAMGLKAQIKQTSDIFSLGATIYHCLTGFVPFRGKELYQVLDEVVHKDPIRPGSLVRRLEPDLETICLKCLEKEPAKRYQTAQELADDLGRYLQSEPIKARPLSAVAKLIRKAKRNKAMSVSIAGAAVILLAVIIGLTVSSAKTAGKLEQYRSDAYNSFEEKKYDQARIALEKFREITKADEEINTLYKKCLKEIDKQKAQADRDKADVKEKVARDKKRAEAKQALDRAERTPGPDKKIAIAEEALKIDPTFADAYQVMGMAYKAKQDYDRAVEYFSKAIAAEPKSAYAYYERAMITAYQWNKPEDAIPDFEKVLQYDPNSHIGYFAKGNIALDRKKYDEAIKSYTKAIKLYPEYDWAYNNRGVAYDSKGDPDKAIADYDEALRLNPKSAGAYINRGNTYNSKGDPDRAIADYDEALRLNPKSDKAYYNRGNAYRSKGEYDNAIKDYDEALRLNPKATPQYADVYYNRGTAYGSKGEYDKAIKDYDEALRLNPKYAEAYINRGIAYKKKGEYARAIADFDEALRLNPKYAEAYINRGNAYYGKGDPDRAIADYDEALRLNPKYAEAYYNRGNAYNSKGDPDKAIADYDEALRINPKYADAYNNRGVTYRNKGDPARAIADFDEALRLNPKSAEAYINRGNAYDSKGDPDRAIADYDEALRINPKYALAYCNRGLAYAGKKDYRRAIADGERFLELAPGHPSAGQMKQQIAEWRGKLGK